MKSITKMVRARGALILEQPFYGSLSTRLKLVAADWLPSCMATDGTHLYYQPEAIDAMPMDEMKGVVCHEVQHVTLGHVWRRQGRDPDRWNIAADFAVNPIVLNAGLRLPEGALVNTEYLDDPAERIYAKLEPPPGSGGKRPEQTPDGRPMPGKDAGGCGGVLDAPPNAQGQAPTPAEQRQQERDWKVAVSQAAQLAKGRGLLCAGLAELVRDIMNPLAPWTALLREFMTRPARDDYSWSRPNRRYIGQGLYLPSVRSETIGTMALILDTSASVDTGMLEQFSAELNAILEEIKPERLFIIQCDKQVRDVQELEPQDYPFELTAQGRGGTRFQPAFDWIAEHDIDPVCAVYFTDMDPADTPEDPGYPVLWADYAGGIAPDMPFGERIVIEA
jgi:predicted metal-dependent peptidase